MKSHVLRMYSRACSDQSEACSDLAVRVLEKPPNFDPETLESIGGLSSS